MYYYMVVTHMITIIDYYYNWYHYYSNMNTLMNNMNNYNNEMKILIFYELNSFNIQGTKPSLILITQI